MFFWMQKVLEFECEGSGLVSAEWVASKINLTINLSSLLKLARQWSSLTIDNIRESAMVSCRSMRYASKLSFQ